MREIFELRLYFTSVRQQYKLDLHSPRKKQADFETEILGILGPKIWNSMTYQIKSARNLNIFTDLNKI